MTTKNTPNTETNVSNNQTFEKEHRIRFKINSQKRKKERGEKKETKKIKKERRDKQKIINKRKIAVE